MKLLGWEVADQSALDQLAAQIKNWGAEVQHGTPAEAADRAVYRLVKFTDPSGIASEAYYGALKYNTPFPSPRPISGFLTGEDLRMGHVVIAVDDFDRSTGFYQEALGMRFTDIVTPSG